MERKVTQTNRNLGNEMAIISAQKCRRKHHVSYDTVLGMEAAFARQEGVQIRMLSPMVGLVNKVLKKLHLPQRISDLLICRKVKEKRVLFIAMGIGDLFEYKKELCAIAKNHELGIYCFDVWQSQYETYEKLFEDICPTMIFFAYKEACHHFSQKYTCFFVPQSMDERFFYPRDVEKTRMFIQIGRRNEEIHQMIEAYLSAHSMTQSDENYLYEKKKGCIIFPDTNDLAIGIAQTKYFVGAPQSRENKALTGDISDVTARFYEAMACKTLIIGYKPDTFDELFSSDAMVDLSENGASFDEIISYFEKNPQEYTRIVEENYRLLIQKHLWKHRYEQILSAFEAMEQRLQ